MASGEPTTGTKVPEHIKIGLEHLAKAHKENAHGRYDEAAALAGIATARFAAAQLALQLDVAMNGPDYGPYGPSRADLRSHP